MKCCVGRTELAAVHQLPVCNLGAQFRVTLQVGGVLPVLWNPGRIRELPAALPMFRAWCQLQTRGTEQCVHETGMGIVLSQSERKMPL